MLRLTLCALLVAGAGACGKIKTLETSDAGPDEDEDGGGDVTPGEVTVEFYEQFEDENFDEPVADQPVLFFGPDGAFIEETATDEDGKASGTVPPGSTVAVMTVTEQNESIAFAIFDVQPGDDLVFGSPVPSSENGASLGSMTIEVPALDPETGVSYYEVYTGCSQVTGDNVIESVQFYENCATDGAVDVLVRAFDGSDQAINVTSKHQTFMADGVISIGSWKGNDDLELAATHVPAELHDARYTLVPAKGRVRFGSLSTPLIEPDSDAFDASIPKLDTFGDRLEVSVAYQPTQENLGQQMALYVLEADASDLPLPLDEELLPWFGFPSYSEPEHRWSWNTAANGRAPDAQYLFFYGTRKGADEQFGWIVVVPPDRTSVTLPDLPDEYDDYRFEDYVDIEAQVLLGVETNEADGYDIRRKGLLPFWSSLFSAPANLDIGSTWRVSMGGEIVL